jgi:hypothetical protein
LESIGNPQSPYYCRFRDIKKKIWGGIADIDGFLQQFSLKSFFFFNSYAFTEKKIVF